MAAKTSARSKSSSAKKSTSSSTVGFLETPEPAPSSSALKLKTSFEDGYDVFAWTCPRCKHEGRERIPRRARSGGITAARKLPGSAAEAAREGVQVTLRCHCHQAHKGRAAGDPPGCGHYFNVFPELDG
jgi:hypothetical protein